MTLGPVAVGTRVGTDRGAGVVVDVIPAAVVERRAWRWRPPERLPALLIVELDGGGRTVRCYQELREP